MNDQKIDPAVYVAFAGEDHALWRAIIGQRLIHSTFGSGTIFDIGPRNEISVWVWVRFDNPVYSAAAQDITDTIVLGSEAFEKHVTELTLPPDLTEEVLVYEQQQEEAKRKAEAVEKSAQLSKEEALIAKRRLYMARVGIPYRSTRKGVGGFRRAQCWKCGTPIDNASFPECDTCGWIKCPCGACGCGFTAG